MTDDCYCLLTDTLTDVLTMYLLIRLPMYYTMTEPLTDAVELVI